MRRLALLVPLALLAGCAFPAWLSHRPGPDLQCPGGGPQVYWDGQPPAAGVCATVARVLATPPNTCPAAARAKLAASWPAVEVHWRPDPFPCGRAVLVHGCTPGPGLVQAGSVEVLPWELGHIVWWTCYGRSGEHTDSAGRVVDDADFTAWLATVR